MPAPTPPSMPAAPARPKTYPKLLGWPRVRLVVILSLVFALVHFDSPTPLHIWFARTLAVTGFSTIAYGVFERWPQRLPAWIARWFLQLLGVVIAGIAAAALAYAVQAGGDLHAALSDPARRNGFLSLVFPSVVFAPWIAFVALARQRELQAREQVMQFQLERSELERKAADGRLRLLQAQVQPHFLFNTLAHIRMLVKGGSPRAPDVLDSLIAYLRASVPRLQASEGTVGQELELVRAYLELMHMRMPDRLQYSVDADVEALALSCPPMALLTLVENAIRHGVDPSEEGGRIEVSVESSEGRCRARVKDTGVGLQHDPGRSGSGLETLRERMKLAFGDAHLRLSAVTPHGTSAELDFPAVRSSP